MRFIESDTFANAADRELTPDDHRLLDLALMAHPGAGAVIRASGGVRKLRWPRRNTGRRGGLRVIYYWWPEGDLVYLLLLYAKAEQSNLTASQVRKLKQAVLEEFE